MLVTLDEMKNYLRVDFDDDNSLLDSLLSTAEGLCMDILRTEDISVLTKCDKAKIAVLYTVAYLYEHREAADHHALTLTLRALLGGDREAGF